MIAIVTDSSSHLTREEARILGVRIVPLAYMQGGRVYYESHIDQNGDYERLLADYGDTLTTAQSSPDAFMGTFEELLRKGFSIICITISSRLSGTFSSATIAARELGEAGRRIFVLDSLLTAGCMYFLVQKARELIDQGLELREIFDILEKEKGKTGVVFSLDDMQPLRRSGRIGIVRQSVGTILNLRPILMCSEGAVVSVGISRGRNDQIRRMLERVPQEAKKLAVHCIVSSPVSDSLAEEAAARFPEASIELRRLGPVLGIHLGLSVVAISWMIEAEEK